MEASQKPINFEGIFKAEEAQKITEMIKRVLIGNKVTLVEYEVRQWYPERIYRFKEVITRVDRLLGEEGRRFIRINGGFNLFSSPEKPARADVRIMIDEEQGIVQTLYMPKMGFDIVKTLIVSKD